MKKHILFIKLHPIFRTQKKNWNHISSSYQAASWSAKKKMHNFSSRHNRFDAFQNNTGVVFLAHENSHFFCSSISILLLPATRALVKKFMCSLYITPLEVHAIRVTVHIFFFSSAVCSVRTRFRFAGKQKIWSLIFSAFRIFFFCSDSFCTFICINILIPYIAYSHRAQFDCVCEREKKNSNSNKPTLFYSHKMKLLQANLFSFFSITFSKWALKIIMFCLYCVQNTHIICIFWVSGQ